jgi:hypothetical protein
MVEDFLEQLCAAIPSTEGEFKDGKLELRLTDRKKPCNDDGCACVLFVHLSTFSIPWLQVFRHSHTTFPEGNGRKHPTLWLGPLVILSHLKLICRHSTILPGRRSSPRGNIGRSPDYKKV